jgi:predicted deacylase
MISKTQFRYSQGRFDAWPSFDSANVLGDPSWDANAYADWIAGIDALALFTKNDLGLSSDNTQRIYAYEAGNANGTPVVLVGGQHGSEVVGQQAAMRWSQVFAQSAEPLFRELRQRVHLTFVPTACPYQYRTPEGRLNANGVDPNRNWDYAWADYEVTDPDYDAKGSAPFSEPETTKVRDLISAAGVVVDCHNYGSTPAQMQYVYPSPGADDENPSRWVTDWASRYGTPNSYTLEQYTPAAPETPSLVSWAAAVQRCRATVLEINDTAFSSAGGFFRHYTSRTAMQLYCGAITEFVVASLNDIATLT